MKRNLLIIFLMASIVNGFGQFIPLCSYPNSVDLFGLCEISFNLPIIYSNPYDPDIISVNAEFTSPDNRSYTVNAFYYEDYAFQQHNAGYELFTHNSIADGWRVRFTPTIVGTWTFKIRAFDENGELNLPFLNMNYSFSCTSVNNAKGFISVANSRFLKRDVVRNGQRQFHSFFPIGPDIAWYSCLDYPDFHQPRGIYEYKRYLDSLDGNANYMRVIINRYQYISLYGPEYTQTENGQQKVYFDSIINQKDSAELDFIIEYARQHGVNIMPCIFNFGDFCYQNMDPYDVSIWGNNPFHNILGLDNPCEFFTDDDAKKISKNLIRYVVSRWGYATNIMSWELWSEVDNIFKMCDGYNQIEQDVQEWHEEMTLYLRGIDPFNHIVSTSMSSVHDFFSLFSSLYNDLDFVQMHDYENIQNAESRYQLLTLLYKRTMEAHVQYPSKLFFMGEFGFGIQSKYADRDPFGIDLHNSLWSSLFFTSMGPASFWWWNYVDECGLYHHFTPLLNFVENMPIPSASFTAQHTGSVAGHKLVFPNNLQTYYMINASQDTIYGWSQDTAFAYQSLRWLTDSVYYEPTVWGPILRFKDGGVYDSLGYVYTLDQSKRPAPSSNNNTITLPVTNQPVGSRYLVRWYDSETGNVYNTGITTYAFVNQDAQGNKYVSFQFPSYIRNLRQHTIDNTFGDAVFVLVLNNPHVKE